MKSTKILLFTFILLFQISCSSDNNGSTVDDNGNGNGDTPIEKVHNGNVIIENQGQLNAFIANNYTTINGSLEISGESVITTTGLESLKKIYGNIFIGGTKLTNIDGLINVNIYPKQNPVLNEILFIWILGNSQLQNINGLQNISNPLGTLDISNNAVLENIDGLSNISTVNYRINIESLSSITNINGLSGISNPVKYLEISDCSSLMDVSGLANLPRIKGVDSSFFFRVNKSITSLNGLTNLTTIDGELLIDGNSMLENIDGLSNLETCGSLNLSDNASLNNFCGLNSLVNSNTVFGITISYNLYNPTLLDLQNGDCSQ